jgi:arylsulfatase A-like enzyme
MAPGTNVLFITADQWRGDCLGAAEHPVVRTPNLDRLAAGGASFRRHFAQAAPCGPSRAALYTGMYLMNHRSVSNGTPLDARHDNVALVARRQGYQPALFGYTDTSIDPRTVPADDARLFRYEGVLPGFDPVCHLPEGEPFAWLEWMRADGLDVPEDWRSFVDRPAGGSGWRTQYDAAHSQTRFLTDRFIEWADGSGRRANGGGGGSGGWFAHVSFLRPHPPFLAPAPYDTMFEPGSVPTPVRAGTRAEEGAQHPLLGVMIDHPFLKSPDDDVEQRELQATYYGMLAEVDDQIARILDWLDASGQADRTLVIFTSDHGENLGDHYMLHKLGWFDESYHVPLIVRGPGVRAGVVVDAFTEHVDVLPTICSLLGADIPLQCDGRALTPWLQGSTPAEWRGETHFEFDFRDPDSALIEEVFGLTLEECALAVLRDEHGKYVQFSGYPALPSAFFDLDTDPAQLRNVVADPAYAATVLGYAQRMLAWRMQHTERTLTGMKLTMHAGLVERNAPRR